jgi:uncharacterized protein YjbI with pentapeptide repeats
MANEEHLARLKEGVGPWNTWRNINRRIQPDLHRAILTGVDLHGAILYGARLDGADLHEADLHGARLQNANLGGANLRGAILDGARLSGAHLCEADFTWARLTGADLAKVDLTGADLLEADLSGVNLTGANLTYTRLVKTNLTNANLTGCKVYGTSAWELQLAGAIQSNLIITQRNEPSITVDNLEVAQFIYLLLNNTKIRNVIDTITSKAVLILGRFTPERKAVLDAIREELRRRDCLPIVFDFTPSASQTTLETISTLAHMARFVIADLTDAKSVLQELHAIVPNSPSVLIQPILLASQEEPGMFDFFHRFPWVLETYRYHSFGEVLASLEDKVIAPAERKAKERSGTVGT